MAILGVPADADPTSPPDVFEVQTQSPSGMAINPRAAARCVWEYVRTAKFLRAMEDAIRAAQERFPGEQIHVLEAGCGPLAALSLPFALRYSAHEVQFSLLDIHQISLDSALSLADTLGVRDSIRHTWCQDAAVFQIPPDQRPHIMAVEVMQRALMNEPQVAVTQNLYPQLRSHGLFLPARIEVELCLFAAGRHYEQITTPDAHRSAEDNIKPIALACCLEAPAPPPGSAPTECRWETYDVAVPPYHETGFFPHLFTRIHIWGKHTLTAFQCSLNLPAAVDLASGVGRTDSTLAFTYEMEPKPGLRATVIKPNSGTAPEPA